jgi:peroxiredoxin
MKKAQAKKNSPDKSNGNHRKGSNPFAWIITGIAVVIVAVLVIDRMNTPDLTPRVQEITEGDAQQGGMGAAPAFDLPDANGGSKSLDDYKGKVVMLNFWATWCGPCKKEIPDFIELQDEYRDQGFEIVGLSLDQPGQEDMVKRFVKENNMNYDVLFDNGAVAQAYGGVRSIPTTFLINRDGEIVSSVVGLQSKAAWAQAIERLL